LVITVPPGTAAELVDQTMAREAQRSAELAVQGHLVRLWALPASPGQRRTLGLWRARDDDDMDSVLAALPLYPWMDIHITALSPHPNDPAPKN
jgi:muconolactone delta-isomerase